MKHIEVLGSGCTNCKNTAHLIEEVAKSAGIEIDLQKVEDMQAIVKAGIMRTPGVIIDGKIVHSGGVPSREKVQEWFSV